VSLDDTIVLHGCGDKKLIEERCEQVPDGLMFLFHQSTMKIIHILFFIRREFLLELKRFRCALICFCMK
jgi:hypothetical protein